MNNLFIHIRRYLGTYFLGFLFLIVTDAGQIFIPKLIGQAVDKISSGQSNVAEVGRLMLILAGLSFLIAIGRYGWRIFVIGSARRVETDLRLMLYKKLLVLTGSFFENNKTGDLMSRFTNDLHSIRMAIGMGLIAFVDGFFMILVILITLFVSYGTLGLVIVLPLPLLTILALVLGKIIGPLFYNVHIKFSQISSYLQEILTGIKIVQSFVMERKVIEQFSHINKEYSNANMNLVRFWGMAFPAMSFLTGLCVLLLLYFGGQRVLFDRLSPGDFIAMLGYLQMIIWPAMGAGWVINLYQRGVSAMKRINEVLYSEPDIIDQPDALQTAPDGDFTFHNLSFSYNEGSPILKEVSFIIPKGQKLGILGRTGSGKTTLLKLISRLLDPPENSVMIGGQDIRKYTRSALRQTLGIVPQDIFLFSDTIRNNIIFARPDASEEEIDKAIHIAGLKSDLPYFSEGLQTIVGEKGVTLSGGQKQRIAIARAIITDPQILILDDALSAVDADTEERILNGLFEVRAGQTTLMVSHRISALARCDRIIVLENGTISAEGSHKELLSNEGFYREIADLQKLEQ